MGLASFGQEGDARLTATGIEFGELARCLARERKTRELRVHVAAYAALT